MSERGGAAEGVMREQNSQNKQCRIPCLPFLSFLRILLALLKINGAANKSEFLVQPKWSREGTDCCKSHAGSAVPKASTWMIRQGGVDKCRAKKFFSFGH